MDARFLGGFFRASALSCVTLYYASGTSIAAGRETLI
jgi:hypothetical protein